MPSRRANRASRRRHDLHQPDRTRRRADAGVEGRLLRGQCHEQDTRRCRDATRCPRAAASSPGEHHAQDVGRQRLAPGGEVLRIGALHRIDAHAQPSGPVLGQRRGRDQLPANRRRRGARTAISASARSCSPRLMSAPICRSVGGGGPRVPAPSVMDGGTTTSAAQRRQRQPAVVAVLVVRGGKQQARRPPAASPRRSFAAAPVEPRRTVVGAWEIAARRLEVGHRRRHLRRGGRPTSPPSRLHVRRGGRPGTAARAARRPRRADASSSRSTYHVASALSASSVYGLCGCDSTPARAPTARSR